MTRYLTPDEAAGRLNMSVDELNELAKKRDIRAFSEKGSGFKFREEDIDEYASSTTPKTKLRVFRRSR